MHLLVGLGNPGQAYAGHRHNVGFMAVEAIAAAHGFGPWRSRFRALVSEGTLAATKVLLMKPQTYMNLSGDAVGEAVRFYKLAPGDVTVIHDELDLAPGRLRIKTGGGDAGHNGLRSITAGLGADYRRVRIGIGHPGVKDRVASYALQNFAKDETVWLAPLLEALAASAPDLVRGAEADVMNRVALAVQPPRPRKERDAGTPGEGER